MVSLKGFYPIFIYTYHFFNPKIIPTPKTFYHKFFLVEKSFYIENILTHNIFYIKFIDHLKKNSKGEPLSEEVFLTNSEKMGSESL